MKRLLALSAMMTLLAGACAPQHELVLYNRSGQDLEDLHVLVGQTRIQIGKLKNRSAKRFMFRADSVESPYVFFAGTQNEQRLGDCGYPTDLPFQRISHIVVFEEGNALDCSWLSSD